MENINKEQFEERLKEAKESSFSDSESAIETEYWRIFVMDGGGDEIVFDGETPIDYFHLGDIEKEYFYVPSDREFVAIWQDSNYTWNIQYQTKQQHQDEIEFLESHAYCASCGDHHLKSNMEFDYYNDFYTCKECIEK